MLILAVETTGRFPSAALTTGESIVELTGVREYSHLEETVPIIKELLEKRGVEPAKLNAVAVSAGPGSFTGIRIGAATVKALAEVWDKPLIAVPTLKSFAFGKKPLGKNELVAPLFDARRSEVYAAAYGRNEDGEVFEAAAQGAYPPGEFLRKLKDFLEEQKEKPFVLFCGDACEIYKKELEDFPLPHAFLTYEEMYQHAANVSRLAALMYKKGEITDFRCFEPTYLREPEAERKLKAKELRPFAG